MFINLLNIQEGMQDGCRIYHRNLGNPEDFIDSVWLPYGIGLLLVDQASMRRHCRHSTTRYVHSTLGRLVGCKGVGEDGLSQIVLNNVVEYAVKGDIMSGFDVKRRRLYGNVDVQIKPEHLLRVDYQILEYIRRNIGYEGMVTESQGYVRKEPELKGKPNPIAEEMKTLRNQLTLAMERGDPKEAAKILSKMRGLRKKGWEEIYKHSPIISAA